MGQLQEMLQLIKKCEETRPPRPEIWVSVWFPKGTLLKMSAIWNDTNVSLSGSAEEIILINSEDFTHVEDCVVTQSTDELRLGGTPVFKGGKLHGILV